LELQALSRKVRIRVKQVKIPARPYLPISKGGTLQAGAESRLLDIALDALAQGVQK